MDIMAPIQNAINKAINNIQLIIDSSAHGGGAVDPAIVGNNEKKMKEIQEHWADPLYKFFTEPGALAKGTEFFKAFPQNKLDPQIFQQLNTLLFELNNDMLPLNPASEGKSQHAQEPGIVFNMKMQAIELAQLVLMTNVEQFLKEIGEAYIDAAKIFYSKVKRTFNKTNGEEIVINDIKMMDNGDIAIDNDVANLQKCRVVVSLSPKSPNSRFTQRMTQMDVLNLLYKNPGVNAELIAIHQAKLLDTIDYDDEEEKLVSEAASRTIELARKQMENALNPQPQSQQRPPSVSIGYKDLPPDGQQQAAAQAGINIQAPQPAMQQSPNGIAGETNSQMLEAMKQHLSPLTNTPQQAQPAQPAMA
jgi:hypothetical protein